MKQRTAILVAMALTAFVVVLVGAITFSITSKTATTQVVEPEPIVVENLGGGVGQQIQAPVILPTNTSAPTVAAPATTQPKLVSADRATRIALALFPGGKLEQPPELVNYKGKMAYEVVLSGGTVYVDAFTGQVLANIIAVASNSTASEQSSDNENGGGNDDSRDNTAPDTPNVPSDNPPTPPTVDDPPPPPGQHDDDDDGDDHDQDDDDGDDHDQDDDDGDDHDQDDDDGDDHDQDDDDGDDHDQHDDDDGDDHDQHDDDDEHDDEHDGDD